MLRLYAEDLHYLGETEKERQRDCCVHGRIVFSVGDTVIAGDGEWCAGASALRFLRSVSSDHFSGAEEHMIPCCGHLMIPADGGKAVAVVGCSNGVDFDVIHENGRVTLRTGVGGVFSVPFSEYREAVLFLAEQIEDFMRDAPARIIDDPFDKAGYEAFQTEWHVLKEKLSAAERPAPAEPEIDLTDIVRVWAEDISGVSENGISLADGRFINFRECAYRYYKKTAAAGNVSANGMLRNFLLSFIPHRCPRRFSFRSSIKNGAFFVFHPHTNVFISCKIRSAHMAIRPLTGVGVPYTTAVFSDERQRPPLVRKTSPSRFVRSGTGIF